jgi:uncharacterized protein DUF4397
MTSSRAVGRVFRRLAALAAATLLGAGATAALATPASAEAGVGYVRLAHLSPDTPEVDVYVDDLSGKLKGQVFPGVGYGVVSDYLSMPPGTYAVSMRKAGAPASEKPVLTEQVALTEGKAFTVAGVGRFADLGLKIYSDDITAPATGKSKVRVVQASVKAPVLDIAVADGPTIATGAQFATTTDYQEVDAGDWQLKLTPTGGQATTSAVTLGGGTTYTLLVLDGKEGLTTDLKEDASGGEVAAPAGGVATGGGGTSDGLPMPLMASAGAVLLAGIAAAGAVAVRRRERRTW